MPEVAVRRIFQQLVSALDWMHRAGIASRDVKCDNVLLTGPDATVKLADFGWSSCADQVDSLPSWPRGWFPARLLCSRSTACGLDWRSSL